MEENEVIEPSFQDFGKDKKLDAAVLHKLNSRFPTSF